MIKTTLKSSTFKLTKIQQRRINDFTQWITDHPELSNDENKVSVMNFVNLKYDWESTIVPYHIFRKMNKDSSIEGKINWHKKDIRKKEKILSQLETLERGLTEDDGKYMKYKGDEFAIIPLEEYKIQTLEINNLNTLLQQALRSKEDLMKEYNRKMELTQLDLVMKQEQLNQTEPTFIDIMSECKEYNDKITAVNKDVNKEIEMLNTHKLSESDLGDDHGKCYSVLIKENEINSRLSKLTNVGPDLSSRKYYLNERRMIDLIERLDHLVNNETIIFKDNWFKLKQSKGRTFAIMGLIEFYRETIIRMKSSLRQDVLDKMT